MAITSLPYKYNEVIEFETVDHAIQGKMVVCHMQFDDVDVRRLPGSEVDFIRQSIVSKIGEFMIDNKLVEFTQQQDVMTGKTMIRARVFVTPDEQVRLIRTLKR